MSSHIDSKVICEAYNIKSIRYLPAFMDLYRVAHNLNPENSAPKINTPTLGIVGMQDKMLSPNSQRNLISSIPKARIIKYNDGGHCVLETHAKKVARSIEEFANN